MRTSDRGRAFIEGFEGFYAKAYKDQAGIWTIGYGTIRYPNGTPVKKGDICTAKEADEYMAFELYNKELYLNELSLPLIQNQFDATMSFIYNLGEGMLDATHDFGRYLRAKEFQLAAKSMLQYCKYRGPFGIKLTSKGLIRRRKAEMELFLSKD